MKYTTEQGDTFDIIASKTLGNEVLMERIIDANPDMAATLIFSSGVILEIPDIGERVAAAPASAPPWRKRT